MMDIGTLTLNPTIDVACEVEQVIPMRKMRTQNERYDPGGGGINVARVFVRLGGNARCYYLSGGATGVAFDGLLDLHQLVRSPIKIAGATRVSTAVHERNTGQEFRFVPGGPEVTEEEWTECLSILQRSRHDFLVASGSLPRGVPSDSTQGSRRSRPRTMCVSFSIRREKRLRPGSKAVGFTSPSRASESFVP